MTDLALIKDIPLPELEKAMLAEQQVDCPVIHRFGPGTYIREVTIPAGTLAIGHHQNFEHTNVFLKGRVTMLNENGSTTELVAPMIFVGKPGRKVGFITEEMVWLNIYPTQETDIEKLEATYLTKSDGFLECEAMQKGILALTHGVNVSDYHAVLREFGIDAEVAEKQAFDESDMVDLPAGGYKMMVADSPIHGRGLFATAPIVEGEIIAPARIRGFRTSAGRYTNHSIKPNAKMMMGLSGDIHLVAATNISGCSGGNPGEEITINYRDALKLHDTNKETTCLQ